MNWYKGLKTKISPSVPLKAHTTFKIGKAARYFAQPKNIEELRALLKRAKKHKVKIMILGAGSNILVSDKEINALVLRLGDSFFKKVLLKGNYLYAGSGIMLNQLVGFAKRHGLSGLEFLVGIPGTLGGALVMNAGIPGKNISDLVEEIKIMDYNSKIKVLKKKDVRFGYRSSGLAKYIILGAKLRLARKPKKEIQDTVNSYLSKRRLSQDWLKPSAGCIFKNPKNDSAGRLIDLCGLKGRVVGGAKVSEAHANFIVNQNHATCSDVLALMDLVKKTVKKKFGIALQPEIKIWY